MIGDAFKAHQSKELTEALAIIAKACENRPEEFMSITKAKTIEISINDYAYSVLAAEENNDFQHEFGTEERRNIVIVGVKVWSPLIDEWVELPPNTITEFYMNRIIEKIANEV